MQFANRPISSGFASMLLLMLCLLTLTFFQIVTFGDLKPDPVLWHEDSGRRPFENGRYLKLSLVVTPNDTVLFTRTSCSKIFCLLASCMCYCHFVPDLRLFSINKTWISLFPYRQNHSGISGRQPGEAANRLIVNSLQVKTDLNGHGNQMHVYPPLYPRVPYPESQSSYTNQRFHDQGHHRMPPALHPPEVQFQSSDRGTHSRNQGDHGYNKPYHYNERHAYSASQRPDNGSQSNYHDRSNRIPYQHSYSTNSRHQQYQSGSHHNVGHMHQHPHPHPEGPMAQTPIGYGANPYQSGYNHNQNYQPSGATGHHWRGSGGGRGWASQPQGGQNVARGYGHPHQSGNQYSALDRRSHRPPPPRPGYGRN